MSRDPFAPKGQSDEEPPVYQSAPSSTTPVTVEERSERLSRMISSKSLEGYTVVDRNDREATAVLALGGKPVNHVLHLIISLVTCGLWAVVWLLLIITARKEQRIRISVDQYGNLIEEKVIIR